MKYYQLTKTGEFTPLSRFQYDDERDRQISQYGNCFVALLFINGQDSIVLLSTEYVRFCHTQTDA